MMKLNDEEREFVDQMKNYCSLETKKLIAIIERITAVEHNYSRYSQGCRCDVCRHANSEYVRSYRRMKKQRELRRGDYER